MRGRPKALSKKLVARMRRMRRFADTKYDALAIRFGVSPATARRICVREAAYAVRR